MKFKCEKCQYVSAHEHHLKRHIKSVHDQIRNHVCEECGYAASQKETLKAHRAGVHKMEEKKFKYDLCPYKSCLKQYLNLHVKKSHLK